ncbi:MAG: ArsA family ATPase [Deltaproteobacteria bacterium]|nr:ArsA family ATPase [Deltaproteobacteria bacterium]
MVTAISEAIWDRRLVLVTGKGGVGKTTVSAALARAALTAGRRVLVAEVTPDVDTRSPLLSLFGHPEVHGEEPIVLGPNAWGVRITPSTGHKLFLRAALKVRMVVDAAMKSAALRRFLMAAPAFPEIGMLYQLTTLLESSQFHHIIVDLPATGHALGLASLPRTVLRVLPTGLIGSAIRTGLETMTDARKTAAVLVTLPEDMPVTESFELADGLHKLGIHVLALVLNRVPENPFTDEERSALNVHIARRPSEPLLGGREFRRLERALSARRAFYANAVERFRTAEVPMLAERDARDIVSGVERALRDRRVA